MGVLEGRVALITGAGSGIGKGVLQRFVDEGARVMVVERMADRVDQLRSEFGEEVGVFHGDVSRLADNKAAVAEALRTFGQLDIFVGNAGIFDQFITLEDFPEDKLGDAFDEQMAVNVKGALFGAKATHAELAKTNGCMVFTASVASFNSGGGGVLYTASKHAVLGMIRQLASELAPDVRVNGVAPGGVATDLRGLETLDQHLTSHSSRPENVERVRANAPMQRALYPDDLVGSYLFLACRELSSTVTGTTILNDSGSSLRVRRPAPTV